MSSIYAGVGDDDTVVGEAVALDLPAATFGARLVSGMIDYFLLMAILIAGLFLTISVVSDEALATVGQRLTMIVAWLVFPVTLETMTRGKSVGKFAMGLRTVRDDAGPISFGHALVRGILGIAEIGVLAGVPAVLCALTNNKGKRIGDLLAGTYVVRDRARLTVHPPVQCPPHLIEWARSADIAPLPDGLSVSLRQLTGRRSQLSQAAWQSLVNDLSARTAQYVAPPPPAGTPAEDFLAAVSAMRRERDTARLANEAQLRERIKTRLQRS